jgi:Caspase domain
MSLLPLQTEAGDDGPRLHALIIGVADYPFVSTGSSKSKREDRLTLPQIRSPKPSALAIARWLVGNHRNPAVPLGSVELLASPEATWPDANGAPVEIQEPTFAAIKRATKAWRDRCHTSRDNIAFFYFCGHGLTNDGFQFLLPQDICDPEPSRLWDHSIDFNTFRTNMRNCRARTQLFFVDACSNRPQGLDTNSAVGDALIDDDRTAPLPENIITFNAAAPGRTVNVPDKDQSEITCLADALLKALNGSAAKKIGGDWVVDIRSLPHWVDQLVQDLGDRYETPQRPAVYVSSAPIPLHYPATPLVPTRIDWTASAPAKPSIDLVHALRQGGCKEADRPWYDDLECGKWEMKMAFAGLDPIEREFSVLPPTHTEMVDL